jgi:hypothetical protein
LTRAASLRGAPGAPGAPSDDRPQPDHSATEPPLSMTQTSHANLPIAVNEVQPNNVAPILPAASRCIDGASTDHVTTEIHDLRDAPLWPKPLPRLPGSFWSGWPDLNRRPLDPQFCPGHFPSDTNHDDALPIVLSKQGVSHQPTRPLATGHDPLFPALAERRFSRRFSRSTLRKPCDPVMSLERASVSSSIDLMQSSTVDLAL